MTGPTQARAPARQASLRWLTRGVTIGALLPLAQLISAAVRGKLGADPIALALNRLGLLALILLLASLSATPLRILLHASWPMRLRRLLGLLAFGYASLHVFLYAVVDQGLAWKAIVADVTERPFITAGFAAFLLLVPLAATSTRAMVKRLGAKRWQRLHRLVYVAAALASLHFVWRVKKDISQPLAYALVLGGLLAVRVQAALRRRSTRRAAGNVVSP